MQLINSIWSVKLYFLLLIFATLIASFDISVAITLDFLYIFANTIAKHPEPVPKSQIFKDAKSNHHEATGYLVEEDN